MKEFTYVIADPQGIHARPAGALIKAVSYTHLDVYKRQVQWVL